MRTQDLVLTLIKACADRPEFGRTSLQKVAYFASETLGRDLGHRAHYYGPYSDLVEHEVSTLVLGNFIEERVTTLGSGRRGLVRQYHYTVTDDGRTRLALVEDRYPDETAALRDLVERIVDVAGSLDQDLLSQAAKTYFIAKATHGTVEFEGLRQIAFDYGWTLQADNREEIERLLAALQRRARFACG